PMRILRPDVAPRLLTPLPVKLSLLGKTGLDAVLVLPFTRDLSLISPQDFARTILNKCLHAREVHEGFNFRFGRGAAGNVEQLQNLGHELGFDVKVYSERRIRGDVVSSSRIRDLLRAGRLTQANRLLGRAFSIISTPGRGRGYGHRYTVPTINMSRYEELTAADGVYITHTRVGEDRFEAVTN